MNQKVSIPFILTSTLATSSAIVGLLWLNMLRQRAQRLHLVLVRRRRHIPITQSR